MITAHEISRATMLITTPSWQAPALVAIAWGSVILQQSDGSWSSLTEKSLSSKLDLLCNKSLFTIALNLAQSEKVNPPPSFPFFS